MTDRGSDGRRKAVFLDRDGTLNRDHPGFIKTLDDFEMLPGAPEAVARLNRAGFLAVVITNQSGIDRGIVPPENLDAMHRTLERAVLEAGGSIAGIYYCPHVPDAGCRCRKPGTLMVERAIADFEIDARRSYFVGDKTVDVACGASSGCRTALVLSGMDSQYNPDDFHPAPDHVARDLSSAADWILADSDLASQRNAPELPAPGGQAE